MSIIYNLFIKIKFISFPFLFLTQIVLTINKLLIEYFKMELVCNYYVLKTFLFLLNINPKIILIWKCIYKIIDNKYWYLIKKKKLKFKIMSKMKMA